MRKTAKIICLILALVFILSLAPLSAFADEPNEIPNPVAKVSAAGVTDGENEPAPESAATMSPTPEETTAPAENPAETTEPEIPAVTEEESQAKVGEAYYKTLQEAVNAANDNEVDLTKDVDIQKCGITVSGNVTLNLAGHTITAGNSANENFTVTGALILCDRVGTGKIVSATPYDSEHGSGVVCVSGENAKFVMNSGTIETVFADDAQHKGQFAVVLLNGADMDMEGGTINAGWYAIAGNGIYDTQDTRINIYGGEMYSTADYAIYLPQSGTTEIFKKDDNTPEPFIQGAAGGIAIQRGILNISAGKITCDGIGNTGGWDDGTTDLANAAVNVGAKYGDVTLNITGGKFTANGDAVALIKGEKYHTGTVTVTGGSFSSDPSAFVPYGYKAAAADNNFTVTLAKKLVYDKVENGVVYVDGTYTGAEQPEVNMGENSVMEMPAHTVNSIAQAGKGFTAANGSITVTFDAAAMNKASGKEVSISIKGAEALEGAKAAYRVEFVANGENLMPEGAADNGTVTVSIAKPADVANPQVWYAVNGVFVENMNAQVAGDKLTFNTNHLSTYAVTDGTPAATAMVKYVNKDDVEVYDDSLVNAVSNVKPGKTITLIRDVENGDGVIVPEGSNFTIDFAGHTYTVTGSLAGSQGTQTQCFQLLKDSNITMKNGTVAANSADIKMMLQNYSNLTLDNMVLDATKGTNNVKYVLSNNNGDTKITNGTQIVAKPDGVAFDVCSFSSYPSVKVTVDNAIVTGNVEFTGKNSGGQTSALDISGGSFDGNIIAGKDADKNAVKVTGGNFTSDPANYVVPDSAAAKITKGGNDKFYVGAENIQNAAKELGKGDSVTVNQGTVALTDINRSVDVTNNGDGAVSLNGKTVAKGETTNSCDHKSLQEVTERPATCKDKGMKAHFQCVGADGCGKLFVKNKDGSLKQVTEADLEIPVTDKHTLEKVNASEPACGKDGVKEHYRCTVCGKLFADAEGTKEISEKDVTIPATGKHELKKVEEVKATCTKDGVKEHWVCDNCGKMYSDPEGKTEVTEKDLVIPATGHTPGIWRDNDKEHWRVCRSCGEKIDIGEHEFGEWVVTRKPTERLSGRRERKCEVCGYVERDRIPATHGPKTGDESSMGLWVTLLSLSAAAVVGTAAYVGIKKKHSK